MLAHDGGQKRTKDKKAAESTTGNLTLVGEVGDTVCFLGDDSRGKDHIECAEECAKNGAALAILDEKTNQLYLPTPQDHSNPNTKLMSFIGQRVSVTDQALQQGGPERHLHRERQSCAQQVNVLGCPAVILSLKRSRDLFPHWRWEGALS
ncbi:MAG: hypothetical protein AB1898_10905 [Acidobacteriota bacterium]